MRVKRSYRGVSESFATEVFVAVVLLSETALAVYSASEFAYN